VQSTVDFTGGALEAELLIRSNLRNDDADQATTGQALCG